MIPEHIVTRRDTFLCFGHISASLWAYVDMVVVLPENLGDVKSKGDVSKDVSPDASFEHGQFLS